MKTLFTLMSWILNYFIFRRQYVGHLRFHSTPEQHRCPTRNRSDPCLLPNLHFRVRLRQVLPSESFCGFASCGLDQRRAWMGTLWRWWCYHTSDWGGLDMFLWCGVLWGTGSLKGQMQTLFRYKTPPLHHVEGLLHIIHQYNNILTFLECGVLTFTTLLLHGKCYIYTFTHLKIFIFYYLKS